jgi:Na+/melibiose symporter-like transporter
MFRETYLMRMAVPITFTALYLAYAAVMTLVFKLDAAVILFISGTLPLYLLWLGWISAAKQPESPAAGLQPTAFPRPAHVH